MLSPAPPADTGIAHFAAAYFQSADWRLDFYAPGAPEDLRQLGGNTCGLPLLAFGRAVPPEAYDAFLLQMGNSPHHLPTLEAWARRVPAGRRLMYLHEAQLVRLWAPWCEGSPWRLSRLYRSHYPDRRFTVMDLFKQQAPGSRVPRGLRPLLELARPDLILVNSACCEDLLRADLDGWDGPVPPIRRLFHPVPAVATGPAARPGRGLRIGHFGSLGNGKGLAVMIEAMMMAQTWGPATFVVAGYGVERVARRHGLDAIPWVEIHDSPSHGDLTRLMASVDAGVQLRPSTQGESSGVVSLLLGLDKPVVVNRTGSFAELGEAVIAVAPDARADEVASALKTAVTAPPLAAIRELAAQRNLAAFHAAILGLLRERP